MQGECAASYLESVVQALRVNLVERCLVGVSDELLYLREDVPVEVEVELGLLRADHLRKVLPAQLVTVFKFAIVLGLLLYRVIC